MKSELIADILVPFSLIANKHALSPEYQVVEIGKDHIKACAPWGMLEASIDIGVKKTIWVDASTFISIMKSLPKEEVEFEVNGGALHWSCGMTDGRLAILPEVKLPAMQPPPELGPDAGSMWAISPDFIEGLELGGLSCGNKGMQSAGIYGIALDNRDGLWIVATDSVTMSCYVVDDASIDSLPDMTVIDPEVARLIIAVVDGNVAKKDNKAPAQIAITSDTIYCVNKAFEMICRPRQPLKYDIREIVDSYSSDDLVAKLPPAKIEFFIKRATAMAEAKARTTVNLSATEGALSLSFAEGVSSADEYFLAEDLDIPQIATIRLDALRLARALGHVNEVVLDHIERGALVLRGGQFSYIISKRGE